MMTEFEKQLLEGGSCETFCKQLSELRAMHLEYGTFESAEGAVVVRENGETFDECDLVSSSQMPPQSHVSNVRSIAATCRIGSSRCSVKSEASFDCYYSTPLSAEPEITSSPNSAAAVAEVTSSMTSHAVEIKSPVPSRDMSSTNLTRRLLSSTENLSVRRRNCSLSLADMTLVDESFSIPSNRTGSETASSFQNLGDPASNTFQFISEDNHLGSITDTELPYQKIHPDCQLSLDNDVDSSLRHDIHGRVNMNPLDTTLQNKFGKLVTVKCVDVLLYFISNCIWQIHQYYR